MTLRNVVRITIACFVATGITPAASGNSIWPVSEFGVEVEFTQDEIRLIRAYYAAVREDGNRGGRGEKGGRGKQAGLPPGIAKNLARGKAMPPGIAKQYLPDDLRHELPPVRDGFERVIVDGKVLLVEVATRVVRDILYDVVF